MSILNVKNCALAYELRLSGKTFAEIGDVLSISNAYARLLYKTHVAIMNRPVPWTDGLSSRVNQAIRHLGFTNKNEIRQVMELAPQMLMKSVGLSRRGYRELEAWVSVE